MQQRMNTLFSHAQKVMVKLKDPLFYTETRIPTDSYQNIYDSCLQQNIRKPAISNAKSSMTDGKYRSVKLPIAYCARRSDTSKH